MILFVELKAVVKTGVPEALTRHTPVCNDLSAVTGMCQTASPHPHPITTERKGEEGTFRVEVIIAE